MARRRFFKMSGSGNDFVVVDGREGVSAELTAPATVRRLCARGTGVGADGLVVLEDDDQLDFRMLYFNSDGTRAEMCGNAALCVARLAADMGAAPAAGMRFASDAGEITGRVAEGRPEIDLSPVRVIVPDFAAATGTASGERQIGFADSGVPHVVVLCDDVDRVDVMLRGRQLRHDPALPNGANVNFVSPGGDGWRIRTFERGVEGETLACGTGAAASAVLLAEWGESGGETDFTTRSGERLTVRLRRLKDRWAPTLAGEGRLVFVGELVEI